MKVIRVYATVLLVCSFSLIASKTAGATPQQSAAVVAEPEAPRVVLQGENTASVLRLMKFSGALRDRAGNPRTGAAGLTFAFYKDQQGGSPLWLETHNALLDEQGRYTVLLGSTKSDGLPLELFSTGEARWLGVQVNVPGEEEQARVLLVSVPYALKAADAETLGGKPPSAFLLADPVGADPRVRPEAGKAESAKETGKEGSKRESIINGNTNFIAKFGASSSDLGSTVSPIYETAGGFVGIGTTSPQTRLHIFEAQPFLNANVRLMGSGQTGSWMDIFSGTGLGHGLFGYGNQPFVFGTGGQERVRIDQFGRVGIGTSSPAVRLHIFESEPSQNANVRLMGGGQIGAWMDIFSGTALGHGLFGYGNQPILIGADGQERMRVTATGNVGVGTTSPSQKFEVNGNVKITGGGNGLLFPDGSTQTTAAAGAGPVLNPQQVALLRWYSANQTASFAVGPAPNRVAFDGANIWVGNFSSITVTKLRASDGANLGTFDVGGQPNGLAFDGANIWVANQSSNTVTKLRASDGVTLGSFAAGGIPVGVAFDGANIWVANADTDNVRKLRASDGANLGTFAVGTRPGWVAFDGTNIWVANYLSHNVTKLRASDGANLGTFPVGGNPRGVAFDGANIWVVNSDIGSSSVTKLRASDGANLGTFAVGLFPDGVAFDGANIWVANEGSGNVTKLRASDGANLGTFPVGISPRGLAFDGSNIWVAVYFDNKVSKL